MDLNWRSKMNSSTLDTNPSPARKAGTPTHGKSSVRGQTKPDGDFMVGKGGGDNSVNLSAYANRRCGHNAKGK